MTHEALCHGGVNYCRNQSTMNHSIISLMFGRNEAELTSGIAGIEEIKGEMMPRLHSNAATKIFNLDFLDCIEVGNMVDCAEMALRSALMREESRGLHERSDYQDTDENWLKYIMIEKSNDNMDLFTEPVTFPYFKPG